MGRVSAAFRVFFKTLFDAETAARVEQVLRGGLPAPSPMPVPPPVVPPKPVEPPKPRQSEALTLLATLQREARLLDFLKEDLGAYSDEQIGAAVREVHRESAKTLDRLFDIQPVVMGDEGTPLEVPAGFDAGRFRLTGKVTGAVSHRGTLRHHGWEATKCELPTYTGSESAARTIAPAEVEIA